MAVTVTPLYAGLAGLLLLILSYRVVRLRQRLRVDLGDGGQPPLTQAIRAQANFIEYTPLVLLLILLLELAGSSHALLHLLGIVIVAGRIAHAYGLSTNSGLSAGRFAGIVATWLTLLAAAALCILAAFGVKL